MSDRERAVRFVDFGMEEAETTFDAGGPVSQEEIDAMRERLDPPLRPEGVGVVLFPPSKGGTTLIRRKLS